MVRVLYRAPSRTIESYSNSIGGLGTAGDFLEIARLQQRGYWRADYTVSNILEYFRAGFSPAP